MSEWIKDTVALLVLGAVIWSGFALTVTVPVAG